MPCAQFCMRCVIVSSLRRQPTWPPSCRPLIRGLFFEGWKPAKVPVKMTRQEFLERVRRKFSFEVEGGVELLWIEEASRLIPGRPAERAT
jgi:hypothetical protein